MTRVANVMELEKQTTTNHLITSTVDHYWLRELYLAYYGFSSSFVHPECLMFIVALSIFSQPM